MPDKDPSVGDQIWMEWLNELAHGDPLLIGKEEEWWTLRVQPDQAWLVLDMDVVGSDGCLLQGVVVVSREKIEFNPFIFGLLAEGFEFGVVLQGKVEKISGHNQGFQALGDHLREDVFQGVIARRMVGLGGEM
jgi:hypothetical protein